MKFRTNPDRFNDASSHKESAPSKSSASFDLVIAGGGASGVLAALVACDEGLSGKSIAIIEKEETLLRKVRASGNGRCNLANMGSISGRYHGRHPQFVRGAFSRVTPEMLLSYFRSIGLITTSDEEGRVYPRSMQANSVVLTLTRALDERCIEVYTEKQLVRISRESSRFLLDLSDGTSWDTRALVIASGGPAAPNLGGDSSGLRLLMSLGHTCETPLPALVPLELRRHPLLQKAEGVRFRGQAYFENREEVCSETVSGEFLITSYGMSGIAAMELGRAVSMAVASALDHPSSERTLGLAASRSGTSSLDHSSTERMIGLAASRSDTSDLDHSSTEGMAGHAVSMTGGTLPYYSLKERAIDHHNERQSEERSCSNGWIGDLVIDFLPEFSEEELVSFFYMQSCTVRTMADRWRVVLAGLIPAKIADALLAVLPEPLAPDTVARMIKTLRLPVMGTRGFDYAQVTAGGITTQDFDPRTLESYKVPRLFAAGEVLDIDGDTGGFNLMWAFSSGMLAGTSAARALQKKEAD